MAHRPHLDPPPSRCWRPAECISVIGTTRCRAVSVVASGFHLPVTSSPSILSRKRRATVMQRAMLLARVTAVELCLALIAVLAAECMGWDLDSYSRAAVSQFRS
uniref:CASP-like protein n=1 Tax=Setaria viridis TaxID=4556 RepID=A0A4U6TLT2_SETVI|nr:hypothetical protein SEVIR_8G220307v2 [Setaria viridis]